MLWAEGELTTYVFPPFRIDLSLPVNGSIGERLFTAANFCNLQLDP